jgi:hypothetical protein
MRHSYTHARQDRPQEYVFKNEIANQLFLQRHNPDLSGLLTEFRVGSARMDVVVINGTTTCYEIKTDRDELRRLPHQVSAASLVFDRVYVTTTVRFAQAISDDISIPRHVGIYCLTPDGRMRMLRRAVSNAHNVSPSAVFDCLRQSEYVSAVRRATGGVPNVPNTKLYRACKELFLKHFGPREAHTVLARALRRRAVRKGDRAVCSLIPYEARLLYFDTDPKKRPRYAARELYLQPISV